MESHNSLVWTVIEGSLAGDTMVGVFTSLEGARAAVSTLAGSRLEDYRIEGHVLDQDRETAVPWQVTLSREGSHLATSRFVGCNCGDDEVEFLRRSFIADGGNRMSVIVFAPTPGLAIATAGRYHAWLLGNGHWSETYQPLQPLDAAPTTV